MEWGRREEAPNQGAPGDAPPVEEAPPAPATPAEPPRRWASRDEGTTGGDPAGGEATRAAAPPVSADDDPFAERPELFVGAAFVGGFALARIVKRLGP